MLCCSEKQLESANDVRCAFDDLLKRSVQRFVWHRDIQTRYMDGRLNVHIHGVVADECDHVGFCVQCHALVDDVRTDQPVLPLEVLDLDLGGAEAANRKDWGSMLVGVYQGVEPLQRGIPTRVSLHALDDVDGVCGDATPRKTVKMVNMPLSWARIGQQDRERENLSMRLQGDIDRRNEVLLRQFPDDVIERRPDVGDAVPETGAQTVWRLHGESRLDPPVLAVYLGLETVRLRIQEGPGFRFECVKVLLCPDDFELPRDDRVEVNAERAGELQE